MKQTDRSRPHEGDKARGCLCGSVLQRHGFCLFRVGAVNSVAGGDVKQACAGERPCSVGEKEAGRWATREKGSLGRLGARARPGARLAEVGPGGSVFGPGVVVFILGPTWAKFDLKRSMGLEPIKVIIIIKRK